MNQIDTVLRILVQFIGLLELLTAILAVLLERHNRSNRYVSWLLMLLALENLILGQVMAATSVAQAEPWLYVSAAITLATFPSLLVVTLSLLRPAAWVQKRWERWLWRLVHLLILIPFVLVLSDAMLGSRLLYVSPDPQVYQGGFIHPESYLQGTVGLLLYRLGLFVIAPVALLLTIYTLWLDRQATPLVRRRARWLLVAQLTIALIQSGLRLWLGDLLSFGDLLAVVLTNLVFAGVYAFVLLRGLFPAAAVRQRLADTPLRLKLYISLGASIAGLLVVAIITIYSSVANQQLVNRTLTRQRQLADRTSEINSMMVTIQDQTFGFYNTWSSTGSEDRGGFEESRRAYLTPLQGQIDQIRDIVAEIEQLEPDEQTRTNLAGILSSLDTYETSLLQMSDHIESLGFQDSGEVSQIEATMDELQGLLDDTDLASLQVTVKQIGWQWEGFFPYPDPAYARPMQNMIEQLIEQIAATDDDQLAPADKARLNALVERYRDHLLEAVHHLSLVDQNRQVLIDQSDLIRASVGSLFEQQRIELDATLERLRGQQANATLTVISLTLLIFFVSGSIVYAVAGQIIRPVQMLGEAAERLGAGELDVRAAVHGHDEIGTTARAFNLMADRLQEVLAGLEQRVAERTRELEQRSAYLEASAEVGRAATSILETDRLIQQVVELIRERFGLYYVGLFLRDETGEWAVLRAGTGEAGRAMLARGHRIKVGEGMIGWSVAHSEARVALEAGEDAVRLATAELPDTRSEAALPLRSHGQVLGALTVQHTQSGAFDQDTLVVLQTMADQVAVALDNARLFVESQAALEEVRRAYGELSREAWAELLRARPDLGYRSDEHGVTSAEKIWRPEMERALQEGEIIQGDGAGTKTKSPLAVPIKVRGDVIGVLDTYKPGDAGEWTPEEIALLETLAEQLGLALDSARLYQDTQRRAAREQLTREITEKMRSVAGVEDIIQTAVDELSRVLGTSRTFVRLGLAPLSQDDRKNESQSV
jgi:GAF domain-containing protein/HAMP domain-containing protein